VRHSVRALVELVARTLPAAGPVYEFGSFQVQPPSLACMRGFFPDLEYVGCDMREGPGVDQIQNLERLALPDGAAGTILCLETLEHVERPWKAAAEMARVLTPGGWALVVMPFAFPIHEYPGDFWRATPSGLKLLLGDFDQVAVGGCGRELFPHTVWGLGLRSPSPALLVQAHALLPKVAAWAERFGADGELPPF
jgi:SAM-dependent methyltransferase